ncbi:MAG: hypothetical protein COX57_01675 [Alphaproteobacteria bacterium CG_4_10_14_0_2_um_filter_63_37]|nr:MAG: hypothetical protein AUJ55_12140 [Proteobacteria bacterium CG1_02_64_396]PJA25718.1 MAG: hypothetical protein COX57_01675 [Alphaproteobacteria bacterium CG_4_10_14_0_2_um_filter_63_37]
MKNRPFAAIPTALMTCTLLLMVSGASASGYGPKEVPTMPMAQGGEGGGAITLLSPKQGETLMGGSGVVLRYEVTLGPNGNHLHVYVDDQNPIITHDVTRCPCKVPLPDLTPGKHTVAVKEATSSHTLTGIETSVSFTVQ